MCGSAVRKLFLKGLAKVQQDVEKVDWLDHCPVLISARKDVPLDLVLLPLAGRNQRGSDGEVSSAACGLAREILSDG